MSDTFSRSELETLLRSVDMLDELELLEIEKMIEEHGFENMKTVKTPMAEDFSVGESDVPAKVDPELQTKYQKLLGDQSTQCRKAEKTPRPQQPPARPPALPARLK